MNIITCKININKITSEKLFQGKKGIYLNCLLIPTPNSEYGDYMITEHQSIDEREKKITKNIIGSAIIKVKNTTEKIQE